MILKEACPTCNKEIKSVQTSFIAMGKLHEVYQCGHLNVKHQAIESNGKVIPEERDFTLEPPTKEELYENLDRWVNEGGLVKGQEYSLPSAYIDPSFWSFKECKPYFCNECKLTHNKEHAWEFQRRGVEFIEKTRVRALLGDATMLGKTIQAAIVLRRSKQVLTPSLFLVRGSTVFQIAKKLREWYSPDFNAVMAVVDRINLMPGFEVYVMSQDLLSRKGVLDLVKALGIKSVIIDEAQFYKDTDSERCKALYNLIEDLKIEYRLPMSGTYIKNRMSEAFTVLNLLDPANFNSPIAFKKRWLVLNEKNQYARLNPIYEEAFKRMTSKYIIRREREEVFKDLPATTRDYQIVEITDPYIKKTYNHELGLGKSFLKDPKVTSTQILGWLAKMRSITGMAKVPWIVEWVNEFLNSCDNTIMIGIHHDNVRDTLYNVFTANKLNPLKLSGEDNPYQKARIAAQFSRGDNRILVINTLAGGVGTDIFGCTNAIQTEREWNSVDEEQFEGRMRDLVLQKKPVTITYPIAKGTIDEFFHNMVWEKRNILAKDASIGKADDETTSLSFLKEFAEFVSGKTI